ncbi:MAG: helix-turn-helix transcriptional regulator [Spirochaetales bacterium]|nr:helix-turn-helix transcriptional regulator [Spirochaetales bacterium]
MSDKCRTFLVHEHTAKRVRESTPDEETLYDLADFFKMFGDTTRIKILYALFTSEMCVCDLSEVLKTSQSAISHQLRTLRQADLVSFRKEGKTVIYTLKDSHVKEIIRTGMEHIRE